MNMESANEKKDDKEYEISYLIKDEAGVAEISRVLKQHEAEILEETAPKRIALAYEIKKETAAYFGYFVISMNPDRVQELDKNLKTNPAVLRFLLITPPFKKQNLPESQTKRTRPVSEKTEDKPSLPLSNEALEKKIEEILQ